MKGHFCALVLPWKCHSKVFWPHPKEIQNFFSPSLNECVRAWFMYACVCILILCNFQCANVFFNLYLRNVCAGLKFGGLFSRWWWPRGAIQLKKILFVIFSPSWAFSYIDSSCQIFFTLNRLRLRLKFNMWFGFPLRSATLNWIWFIKRPMLIYINNNSSKIK